MSTSTYLQLCQQTQRVCGISGNAITSVDNQVGILRRLVDWVADADVEIQRKHIDWDFLYDTSSFSQTIVQGSKEYAKESNLGEWDQNTIWINYGANDNQQLLPIDYHDYYQNYNNGTQTQGKPGNFVIPPNKNLIVYPEPDNGTYTLTANYWKTPVRMSANDDVSLIPENYIRAIIARAKMYYAIDQEADDLYVEANREYMQVMMELEYNQLPDREDYGMSGGSTMTVVPV